MTPKPHTTPVSARALELHRRQRALVEASLRLQPGTAKRTHRRWA